MKSKTVYVNLESLAEDHVKSNSEFYICQCPKCIEELNYTKAKLYIARDLSFGYCHRCKSLFKDAIITFSSPDLNLQTSLNLQNNQPNLTVYTSMKKYEMASPILSDSAISYFKNKRKNPELLNIWDEYDMRVDDSGIYIPYPFYDYYIKALFNPKDGMKYFLPPTPQKPLFIIKRESDVWIITEGIFDAIAVSFMNSTDNIVAVTGSTMTRPQIDSLRQFHPKEIYVFLDETVLSEELRDQLSRSIGTATVSVIESDGEDPEEFYLNHYVNKNSISQ